MTWLIFYRSVPSTQRLKAWIGAGTVFIACFYGPILGDSYGVGDGGNSPSLVAIRTNADFIEALHHKLDVNDPIVVFRYVFSTLGDEIVIYPTENYFYFSFAANGKQFRGNFSLFADKRDQGMIEFSYHETTDVADPDFPLAGAGLTFTAADGVRVAKISDFKYSISFEGKTVSVKLNDIGTASPRKAQLRQTEVFVGPSFDESGLKFALIYETTEKQLFWILNEDDFVPETFFRIADEILLGTRTEFVFFDDQENQRKILIGVQGNNVLENNFYDGPFDQLPDNYVYTGRIKLQKYIEASRPFAKGKIDKYGNFLDDDDNRVAISPYLIYFERSDLIEVVKRAKTSSRSKSEFYSTITQERFGRMKRH